MIDSLVLINEMAERFFPAARGYNVKPLQQFAIHDQDGQLDYYRYRLLIQVTGKSRTLDELNHADEQMRAFLKMLGKNDNSPSFIAFDPSEIMIEFT